jgi:predicted Zn-dependent protease
MIRLFFAALIAVATIACATNPATGKRQLNLMSEAQEISAGQEADAQVKKEMGLYNDPISRSTSGASG